MPEVIRVNPIKTKTRAMVEKRIIEGLIESLKIKIVSIRRINKHNSTILINIKDS